MFDIVKFVAKEAQRYYRWKLKQKKGRIRAAIGDGPDDYVLLITCPHCGGNYVLPAEKDASFELTQRKKLGEKVIDTGFPFLLFIAIFLTVSIAVILGREYVVKHWPQKQAVETVSENSTMNPPPTTLQTQVQINGKLVRVQGKVILVGKIINRGPAVDKKVLVITFMDISGKVIEKQRKVYPKISQGETPFEVETGNSNSIKCKAEIEAEG
ncbi:MAG: hypothetical protein WC976_07195 [Caldisericia bacterium]